MGRLKRSCYSRFVGSLESNWTRRFLLSVLPAGPLDTNAAIYFLRMSNDSNRSLAKPAPYNSSTPAKPTRATKVARPSFAEFSRREPRRQNIAPSVTWKNKLSPLVNHDLPLATVG